MPTYCSDIGGLVMTIGSLTSSQLTTAVKEGFATKDIRTLIANLLGVGASTSNVSRMKHTLLKI